MRFLRRDVGYEVLVLCWCLGAMLGGRGAEKLLSCRKNVEVLQVELALRCSCVRGDPPPVFPLSLARRSSPLAKVGTKSRWD